MIVYEEDGAGYFRGIKHSLFIARTIMADVILCDEGY